MLPHLRSLPGRINALLSGNVLHPFGFVLFFVFYNARELDYLVAPEEWLLYSFVLCASAMAVLVSFRNLLASPVKGGLLVFLLFFFVLLYSDLYFLINGPEKILVQNRYIILFFLLLFSYTWYFLHHSSGTFTRINHYLNTLMLLLCLYEGALYVRYLSGNEQWSDYTSSRGKLFEGYPPAMTDKKLPDVYFVVADMYASSVALKWHFDFDNSSFTDSLKKLGFFVAGNAKSNYAYTPLSLSSIFHMDLLPGFDTALSNALTEDVISMAMVNKNPVMEKLSALGYDSRNLSLFRFNGDQKFFSYDHFAYPDYTLFRDKLFSKTLFFWYTIHGKVIYPPETIRHLSDSTLAISAEQRRHPVFAYIHFPIPHEPFRFNRDGGLREGVDVSTLEKKKLAYLEQLQYSNTVLLKTLSGIVKNSKGEAVIVLMGDHGTRFFENVPGGEGEMFSTLTAVNVPSGNYAQFHDSIQHVNVFRALFNRVYGEKYPVLPENVANKAAAH